VDRLIKHICDQARPFPPPCPTVAMFVDGFLVIGSVAALGAAWASPTVVAPAEAALLALWLAREVGGWLRHAHTMPGDVVLITGAGSGLGRLLALRFASEGCQLVLWDLNHTAVEAVARECKARGAVGASSAQVRPPPPPPPRPRPPPPPPRIICLHLPACRA
jgi:hypothetical protein